MKISAIFARQILDSRGNPTIECDVYVDSGEMGKASVPSGASVGKYEAVELRDSDGEVKAAINNIHNKISKVIIGRDVTDQQHIDQAMIELDDTENKSNLGANAILAVSLATASAAARFTKHSLYEYIHILSGSNEAPLLPMPMVNVLNGGKHANWTSDIQEYMIIPTSAQTFSEAVFMSARIFHTLRTLLKEKGYGTLLGDEGGYAPAVKGGNDEPLELLSEAVQKAGYTLGKDVHFALDIAASELFKDRAYHLKTEGKTLTSNEMIDWMSALTKQYPIISLEDGLDQDDWDGWKLLNGQLASKIQIIGDDLYATNANRLQKGIEEGSSNAILIKPNQIGTLTETIEAVQLAQKNGFRTILSHRSGETEDTTISHLAVGLVTGQIKCGSVSRGERVAKYNELLRIEEKLGQKAKLWHI